jgi:hypothetical protein
MTTSCKAVVDYGFGVLNLNRLVIPVPLRINAVEQFLGDVLDLWIGDNESSC